MAKAKILVQLDSDPLPSVFDSVVAIDAGVDQLLRQSPVTTRDPSCGARAIEVETGFEPV